MFLNLITLTENIESNEKDYLKQVHKYLNFIDEYSQNLFKNLPETEGNESYLDDYDEFYDINSLNRSFLIEQIKYIKKLKIYLKDFKLEELDIEIKRYLKLIEDSRVGYELDNITDEFSGPNVLLFGLNALSFDENFSILITNNLVKIIYSIMNLANIIKQKNDGISSLNLEAIDIKGELKKILETPNKGFNDSLIIPEPKERKQKLYKIN